MRVVLAPDSFKKSMTAADAAAAMARGVRSLHPDSGCVEVPMADGGEGTTAALMAALEGQWRTVPHRRRTRPPHRGPLRPDRRRTGRDRRGRVGRHRPGRAGRPRPCGPARRCGPLVIDALDGQARPALIVGLGGTVTTDGSRPAGRARRHLARRGRHGARPSPRALLALDHVDLTALDPRLPATTIRLAAAVTNPLARPVGSRGDLRPARVRHPNRYRCSTACWPGLPTRWWRPDAPTCASCPAQGRRADSAPHSWHWVPRCGRGSGWLPRRRAWTTPSRRRPGATGEGSLDRQTWPARRPPGWPRWPPGTGLPVIAFAGRLGDGADELVGRGFVAVQSITRGPGTLADALGEGPANLERAVATALRIRALG